MPRPTIDYLNVRRALKPASGGTNYRIRERAIYAEDVELIKRRYPFKSQVDGGLKAALDAAGSVQTLARILRLTPATIYQWRQRIPPERIIQIEKATGVPRNVLRPDLYDGWAPVRVTDRIWRRLQKLGRAARWEKLAPAQRTTIMRAVAQRRWSKQRIPAKQDPPPDGLRS